MIYYILQQLASDNSRKFKESILLQNKDNETLKQVINLALNPYITFYQKKIPEYVITYQTANLQWALNKLSNLSERNVTGNAAVEYLKNVFESLTVNDAKVVERIIEKDLKCGVSVSTVNKIWPGLVPTFEVCLCSKDLSTIRYPAIAQIKYDGGRCHMYFDGEKATCFSRNGKEIQFHGALDSAANGMMKKGETWDGEIVFRDSNGLLDRKTSNGLFNKCIRGTITPNEASNAIFICWDNVDFTSTIPYETRLDDLISRAHSDHALLANIWIVEKKIVNSEEDALEFYQSCIDDGLEGAVIKNRNFKWEGKRLKDCVKMKAENDADLLCVGWEEGTGRNTGLLGALVLETSDGKIRVSVGTGFSDAQRMCLTPENTIGKIVEVKYNQRIKSKGDKLESLYLPVFIQIRTDKDVANSSEELK